MYQQLEGGRGRAVYFRSPRIKAGQLLKGSALSVRLGPLVGRVRDFSREGLLCDLSAAEQSPKLGTVLPTEILVENETLFAADAEVVRTESARTGTRVAVRFVRALLDPKQLRNRAQRVLFQNRVAEGISVYQGVSTDYRVALGDAVLMLSHWRDLLAGRDEEISSHESESARSELLELHDLALRRMRIDWQRAHMLASEASERAGGTPEGTNAAKRFTETLLTPVLLDAPIWRQAYRKPRGYPGDFELMNMMYDDSSQGPSTFAKVMHQLGREERLAATVRHRKDFLVAELGRQLGRQADGVEDLRVTNVGAGPARELEEFLLSASLTRRLVVTLIDQDQAALEYAHERLRGASLHLGDRVELRCRFVSFGHLLANDALTDEVRDQDLIYTAGLFDYLADPVAAVLLTRLAQLLRKNGRLLIGNAVDAPNVKWVPEFVLDWQMIYRAPDEMRRIATAISDACRLDVLFDRSGAWQFLEASARS